MGSSENDAEAKGNEKPQHHVVVSYSLAIGCYPVTFGEYDHFCEMTQRQRPEDKGWSCRRRPVINVSWDNAEAYIKRLQGQTGRPYRLFSEAKWEYACRGGTATRYSWGDTISPERANYPRTFLWIGGAVAASEVGCYPANAFGRYDLHGNTWEWVQDRRHGTYDGAPDDGGAWVEEPTYWANHRVCRGGSWCSPRKNLRSARRHSLSSDFRGIDLGFRVARTFCT